MPVSIVVGGQFGSEGKGKVSLEMVRRAKEPVTVVRVGGPNSGHTAYDRSGRKWALRQMPAGAVDRNVDVVFPAGSYIDVDLLMNEIRELGFPHKRIKVSGYARIITAQHRAWEASGGLVDTIGSTGSGVGAAVMAAVARGAENFLLHSPQAGEVRALEPFIDDAVATVRDRLTLGQRVVIEGTQGFGLSLLDGGHWPKATARTTTAAGAIAEAGLSPLDVDDITLVLRSFPIRVAGDSGPLLGETSWQRIAEDGGLPEAPIEYTTVTNRVRRVGNFDVGLVRRAIAANRPNRIVLNHLDYVGQMQTASGAAKVSRFLEQVETNLGTRVDWLGFSPMDITMRERVR